MSAANVRGLVVGSRIKTEINVLEKKKYHLFWFTAEVVFLYVTISDVME